MKSFSIDKKSFLTSEEKEQFFHHLESNNAFFKEAFETMLTLVISDPILTYQVADLIEADYRPLYLAIVKKREQVDNDTLPGCCQKP